MKAPPKYDRYTSQETSLGTWITGFVIVCIILGGIIYAIIHFTKKSKNENFLSYKSMEKEEESMKTHHSYL
jgi:hypothetical protein